MYVCVYIVSICKYTENVNKCLLACAIPTYRYSAAGSSAIYRYKRTAVQQHFVFILASHTATPQQFSIWPQDFAEVFHGKKAIIACQLYINGVQKLKVCIYNKRKDAAVTVCEHPSASPNKSSATTTAAEQSQ